MTDRYTPLRPLVEPKLMQAQPKHFRPRASNGWIGYHAPDREDRNPSFAVRWDSEDDPGAFVDHGTGEHGSVADLARKLGIDPRVSSGPGRTSPLAAFCLDRKLDSSRLIENWGIQEVTFGNRPALRYPTPCGIDRIKFLDSRKPKYYWAGSGGKRHWYGLDQALSLKIETLYIVNGEPAVWACHQSGVAAVCLCGGEGARLPADLIDQMRHVLKHNPSIEKIRVVYDVGEAHDKQGSGSRSIAEALGQAGWNAAPLGLPADLGIGGDVDDLHRRVGDAGLSEALAGLSILDSRFIYVDNRVNRENQGFKLTLLSDLLREDLPETRFVVDELLPTGGLSILAAKPKVGKSTLARTLALCVARGEPFLGRDVTMKGTVIHLALEEKRKEIQRAYEKLGGANEPIHVHVGMAPAEALEALEQSIKETNAVLAIVDPIFKLIRLPDLDEYGAMTLALEPLIELSRRTNCHIVCVHHLGKGDRMGGDAILGSTAIFGAVDVALLMKKRDMGRTIESIQRYGKDLEETVVALNDNTGFVTAAGNAEEIEQRPVREEIIAEIKGGPKTEAQLRDSIGGNQKLVADALRFLVRSGRIVRSGEGKRGSPYVYDLTQAERMYQPDNSRLTRLTHIENRENREIEKPAAPVVEPILFPASPTFDPNAPF